LVFGNNVSYIEPILRDYHKNHSDIKKFEITLKDNKHPFTIKTLGWKNILNFRRRQLDQTHVWQKPPFDYTICEIFLIVKRTDRYTGSPLMDVCAVAPAHLVFDKKQVNEIEKADSFYLKKYSENPISTTGPISKHLVKPVNTPKIDSENEDQSNISKIRCKVECRPKTQQFLLKAEGNPNCYFDLEKPLLLSYRRQYYKLSCTQSYFCCPEIKCKPHESIYCPHRFINDIALFPVNPKLAHHFFQMVEENNKQCLSKTSYDSQNFKISAELKEIKTVEELKKLSGKNIMIKGMHGTIIFKKLKVHNGQDYGAHITFSLSPKADVDNPA